MCELCEVRVKPRPSTPPPARLRLWQLEPRFHCALIGTCLSLDELRRLARKLRVPAAVQRCDYELHRHFVAVAGRQVPAARLLQRSLDRRFADDLRCVARTAAGDLARLWDGAMESGEVAGAFWALISHSHTPAPLQDRVYAEVHMLSHLSGASLRVDLQELNRLRRAVPALEQRLAEQQRDARNALRERDRRADALEASLQALRRPAVPPPAPRRARTRHWPERLRRIIGIARRLQSELDLARRRLRRAEDQASALRGELARFQEEALRWRNAVALSGLEPPDAQQAPEPAEAGGEDLCGRCVLYVGGRDRSAAQFRALVEERNGRFVHHDGGREQDRRQLDALLPGADLVMCPVDCVSHDAAARVKHYCKRHDTCLLFLGRASTSAFQQGLEHFLAAG